MYRILIADDEFWVGRWLSQVLKESPFEVEVAGISENGEEALKALTDTRPDILITDINMPLIDGLDVLKRLEEAGEKLPKTIVISGYDEFEYARRAIELEVMAYLLKPLERSAVYEAVEKAVAALEKEQERKAQTRDGFTAGVENILTEYLRSPGDETKRRLCRLMDSEQGRSGFYELALFQMRRLEKSALTREEMRSRLEEAAAGKAIYLCPLDRFTWGVLITDIVKPAGFRLDESVLVKLLHNYEYGLSEAHGDPGEIDEAFAEARESIILRLGREGKTEAFPVSESDLYTDFLTALKAGNMERLKECTVQACGLFIQKGYDLTSCLNFYFVLSGEVIKLLNDRYKEQNRTEYLALIEEGYDFSVRIRNYYSIRSICHRFEEYAGKAASCLKEEDCMDVAVIVKRIQREIREHYSEDISLAWVADEYGINPSYFSKKFKDETGVNFIDYLTEVRIGQAKELLSHTNLSVSAVSLRVGFKEAKYFSRVFASMTGEKPSEYRERVKREGELREESAD
ncbi:MAG: helix-turn-helix domain-containing protein [Clostridiales bacterium]|nr:helix-turn-helix domain-containing protein [Clostridiales bacterium]